MSLREGLLQIYLHTALNSARDDGGMMEGWMMFAAADEGFSFLFSCFHSDYVFFYFLYLLMTTSWYSPIIYCTLSASAFKRKSMKTKSVVITQREEVKHSNE